MKKIALLCIAAIAASTTLHAQTLLEDWNFNSDTAGKGLQGITNSGTLNSLWNFNTTTQGDVTNGSGQFVLAGNSTNFTRKLPDAGTANADPLIDQYASPATTGKYLLEVTFAGWTADAASLGDSWKLSLAETAGAGGAEIAQIIWNVDSATTTRIRLATTTTAGSNYRNFAFGLTQATAVTFGIEFDFDNNTVRYLQNGTETHSWTDFNGDNIGLVQYVKNGDSTNDWTTAATSVSLDAMGYSQVPEPTIAGLFGLGLVGFLVRRHRRS